MRARITLALVALTAVSGFSLFETKTGISIISTTSVKDSLPYGIFEGRTWEADPAARYIKLDFILDKPVKLGQLEMELVSAVSEVVTVFINVQDAVYQVYPKENRIVVDVSYSGDISVCRDTEVQSPSVIVSNTGKVKNLSFDAGHFRIME